MTSKNFDIKNRDVDDYMIYSESLLDTKIIDSSSDEEENNIKNKIKISKISYNSKPHNIYVVPSIINFYDYEKDNKKCKTFIIKNNGAICEEIILKGYYKVII